MQNRCSLLRFSHKLYQDFRLYVDNEGNMACEEKIVTEEAKKSSSAQKVSPFLLTIFSSWAFFLLVPIILTPSKC